MALRTVLAEDRYLAREGVRRLLEAQSALDLVAVWRDLASTVVAIDEHRPDVLLTDIGMPPMGTDEGIRAADHLRQVAPDAGALLLSQYAGAEPALALRARAQQRSRPPGRAHREPRPRGRRPP